jgi:hypothetical protein
MDEIGDRAADDPASTDAEQALGRGVQMRDCERVVQDYDRRREALEDIAGVRRFARAARPAGRIEAAG